MKSLVALLMLALVPACAGDRPTVEGQRVTDWVLLLRSPSGADRAHAAHALAQFGPYARIAIKPLVTALGDPIEPVREEAAMALGAMAPDATPLVARVLTAPTVNPEIGRWAALALGTMARTDPRAGEALLTASRSHEAKEQALSLQGLAACGDEISVKRLAELLDGTDRHLRLDAAEALGRVGTGARAAVPELAQAARVDDRDLSLAVLAALGSAARGAERGSTTATVVTSVLSGAMQHADPLVRATAARAAADLASPGTATVQGLAGLLADPAPAPRAEASHTLGLLAPRVDDATLTALTTATSEGARAARVSALHALGALGARAHGAIPVLGPLTKDRDADVRRAASDAVDHILRASAG